MRISTTSQRPAAEPGPSRRLRRLTVGATLALCVIMVVVAGCGGGLPGERGGVAADRDGAELAALRADPMASWLPQGVRLVEEFDSNASGGGKPTEANLTRVLADVSRPADPVAAMPGSSGRTDPALLDPALHARVVQAARDAGWQLQASPDRQLFASGTKAAPGGGALALSVDGYDLLRPELPSGAVAIILRFVP